MCSRTKRISNQYYTRILILLFIFFSMIMNVFARKLSNQIPKYVKNEIKKQEQKVVGLNSAVSRTVLCEFRTKPYFICININLVAMKCFFKTILVSYCDLKKKIQIPYVFLFTRACKIIFI